MSFTSREYRDALGTFATGVCVITANPEGYTPFGMTVNSFGSVSLEPALLLWSLQKDSECAPAFDVATHFTVNVLGLDQEDDSNRYAKKGQHELSPEHFMLGQHGSPIIRDALVSFECELEKTHEGGDHLIIVGRVRDMQQRPTGEPLLFFSGGYRELR